MEYVSAEQTTSTIIGVVRSLEDFTNLNTYNLAHSLGELLVRVHKFKKDTLMFGDLRLCEIGHRAVNIDGVTFDSRGVGENRRFRDIIDNKVHRNAVNKLPEGEYQRRGVRVIL